MIVATGQNRISILMRRLSELKEQVIHQAAQSALPRVKEEITTSFYLEKSPAQKSWAPLKPKKVWGKVVPREDRQILKGVQDYFHVGISGIGKIKVSNSKWYVKFHYTGTVKMADRRYLPFRGEKVPVWEIVVSKPILEKINRLLGGT